MYGTLTLTVDGSDRYTHELRREAALIGRREDASIRIGWLVCEPAQALIERTDEGLRLTHLATRFETRVNGEPVERVTLMPGDEIQIGELTYRVGFEPESMPARIARCSRCRGDMPRVEWVDGGVYRGGTRTRFFRCGPCSVSALDLDALEARYRLDEPRLAGGSLEIERHPCEATCPRCHTRMARMTVGRAAAWVDIEECELCGTVVLDDGEGALLDRVLERRG